MRALLVILVKMVLQHWLLLLCLRSVVYGIFSLHRKSAQNNFFVAKTNICDFKPSGKAAKTHCWISTQIPSILLYWTKYWCFSKVFGPTDSSEMLPLLACQTRLVGVFRKVCSAVMSGIFTGLCCQPYSRFVEESGESRWSTQRVSVVQVVLWCWIHFRAKSSLF